MSADVEGLVESSVNFGVVTLLDDHLFCHLCVRSSISSFLEAYQKVLSALGDLVNATNNIENMFPGPPWQPKFDSELLAVLKRTHTLKSFMARTHMSLLFMLVLSLVS